MKVDAPNLLTDLEAWCEKQAHGMELARNLDSLTKSFDSLLKVMDALFQVRACGRRWGGGGDDDGDGNVMVMRPW